MEQIISNGMKRKVFEFSLAVYRVTDLFPMGEVLKRQTREIANELLREISELETRENVSAGGGPASGWEVPYPVVVKRIVGKMLVLKNFLLLAKYNNFVRPLNVDVLLKELSFFESFFLRQLQYQNDPFWQENGKVNKKNNFSADEPKNDAIGEKPREKAIKSELVYATIKEKREEGIYVSEYVVPPFEKKQEESLRKVFDPALKNGMARYAATAHRGIKQEGFSIEDSEISERARGIMPFSSVTRGRSASDGVEQKTQEDEVKIGKNGYSERQRAILDYLRVKKTAKANDLAVIFSNRFSLKTLQRDLTGLIESKAVERRGDKRWAIYMIRGGEIGVNVVS